MRVFIAIDIDESIIKALGDLQSDMQGKADIKKSDARWVNPDTLHLTLKFLGEIKDEQVVDVCRAVEVVAGRHQNFEFDVEAVGYFGGKSARVLWVGAGNESDELSKLQQDLEQELAQVGWPKENRKFSGHLTLCRVRNPRAGFELAKMTESYKDFKLGTMPADSLCVYQSDLTPKGPIYTVLGNYKLRES